MKWPKSDFTCSSKIHPFPLFNKELPSTETSLIFYTASVDFN